MNNIEEKLWNYIDGACTEDEQTAIKLLIAEDEAYSNKYNELLRLNNEFATMELDEPSMAFTYNVMETIRTENAQQPLKATIDKRIIFGITGFFIITVAALIIYALNVVNWSTGSGVALPHIELPKEITQVHITSYFTGPVVKGFLFFDVIMALFLLDTYLRRRNVAKQH
jgi:hypothetical protein